MISMAGRLITAPVGRPDAGRGVVGERRARQRIGNDDAEVAQEAHDVARPADRNGGRAERILENQIPADDPGNELAERGVGVGVGAAGDRHGGRHLGVAQPGEGAGDAAGDEGEHDRRPGVGGRGVAREHEDAGADDAADAERGEARSRQGAFQGDAAVGRQRLDVGLLGLGLEKRKGLSCPDVRHGSRPPYAGCLY